MAKTFEQAARSEYDAPNSYGQRHNMAIRTATIHCVTTAEASLVNMLRGWYDYAGEHIARYGSKLGDDYVLGPAWFQIGSALLRMLNGELGRLDGGTLDKFIRQTMLDTGFDQGMVGDA